MFIPLLHLALALLVVGTLFRLIEYNFPDTLIGKLLIFSY